MIDSIQTQLKEDGWAILREIVPAKLVNGLRDDLNIALIRCSEMQELYGISAETTGTVHHLPALHLWNVLNFLMENPAEPHISRFFGDKPYILNSCGGNLNFPDATNYAAKIHRDIRSWSPDTLMLNTLVTLDDMTAENGATWLMPGGHQLPEKPSDAMFEEEAIQIEAPAGSILLWDSRLWHKAGVNRTDRPRRILTPIYTKPFFKAGMDYCRALGDEAMSVMSPTLKQLLGWNSRIPATLQEWYQPVESRMYRPDQG